MIDKLERQRPLADTAFRMLFSLIFIVAGLGHLVRTGSIVHQLEASPFGHLVTAVAPPHVLVIATGAVLAVGGVALLLGARTRLAALALITCLVPITVTVQLGPEQVGPLFKNIALVGGLVHFLFSGAGELAWSIDRRRRRRLLVTTARSSS